MSLAHGLETTCQQPAANITPSEKASSSGAALRTPIMLVWGHHWVALHRTECLAVLHGFVLGILYFAAFLVRFDGKVPLRYQSIAVDTVIYMVAVQLACCLVMGAQRGIMRYAAFIDLIRLAEALTVSGLCGALLNVVAFQSKIPRSVILIDWTFAILVLGMMRGGGRLFRERYFPMLARSSSTPVLVLSATHAGEALVREIQRQPSLNMKVVGILDSDPLAHRCTVAGVKVLGAPQDLKRIAERFHVNTLLIPTPAVSGAGIRDTFQACRDANLKIKVVPGFDALLERVFDGSAS